jgi:hypothetical protein
MADDGSVLGNLPRSRPGQRSEKRTGRTAAKAAERSERTGADAAAPPKRAKTAAGKRSAAGAANGPAGARPSADASHREPASSRDPAPHSGDPVGDAIRTVTGVAATGARVAGGVAREVLRRLPRP